MEITARTPDKKYFHYSRVPPQDGKGPLEGRGAGECGSQWGFDTEEKLQFHYKGKNEPFFLERKEKRNFTGAQNSFTEEGALSKKSFRNGERIEGSKQLFMIGKNKSISLSRSHRGEKGKEETLKRRKGEGAWKMFTEKRPSIKREQLD